MPQFDHGSILRWQCQDGLPDFILRLDLDALPLGVQHGAADFLVAFFIQW